MRNILKILAHGAIKIVESMKGFYIPDELPLSTKAAFLFGSYERETSRFIRTHVKRGVAIDVGAHIGYYSRLLSPLVDTVYAFEPDPTNYALLVRNTQRFKNIVPVQMAVSDSVNNQKFFIVENSTFRHSLIPTQDASNSITVTTITLDEFMKDKGGRVSFVKIDVEGHEENVLSGMKCIVEKNHPLVIAEMPINETHIPVSPVIGRRGLVRNYIIII